MGGDVAEEMGDDPLGEVVGQNLILPDQLLEFGGQADVPADDPAHQAFMAHVIQAFFGPVPLAGGIDQGQVSRLPRGQEGFFQLGGDLLGKTGSHKTAGGDRISVPDDPNRLLGGDDFPFLQPGMLESGEDGVGYFFSLL